MRRSQVGADIIAQLEACMSEVCRDYVFSRTRGVPPADCNSITVQWIDRGVTPWNRDCEEDNGCGEFQSTFGLRVTLTRVCMGPDQEPQFNWQLEDGEAACFDDHLEMLEDCLQCGDWSLLKTTHSLERFHYDGTVHDIESDGGGFSAYVEMTLVASECC